MSPTTKNKIVSNRSCGSSTLASKSNSTVDKANCRIRLRRQCGRDWSVDAWIIHTYKRVIPLVIDFGCCAARPLTTTSTTTTTSESTSHSGNDKYGGTRLHRTSTCIRNKLQTCTNVCHPIMIQIVDKNVVCLYGMKSKSILLVIKLIRRNLTRQSLCKLTHAFIYMPHPVIQFTTHGS